MQTGTCVQSAAELHVLRLQAASTYTSSSLRADTRDTLVVAQTLTHCKQVSVYQVQQHVLGLQEASYRALAGNAGKHKLENLHAARYSRGGGGFRQGTSFRTERRTGQVCL